MGRATRWLSRLLGGKKEAKEPRRECPSNGGGEEDGREKKRWSFRASRDPGDIPAVVVGHNPSIAKAAETAWLKSLYSETEREQSKHAIAVAAATAAAADAAVAAAQAAVAVVRLTSKGRGVVFGGIQERAAAAVQIQTAFRGYLSRKALRALKALVKLQALVRGYIVRKKAAATLHSMQALVRAQASVRASMSRHLLSVRARRSLERHDDTRSEHAAAAGFYSRLLSASVENGVLDRSPKIVEVDPGRPRTPHLPRRTSRHSVFDPDVDAAVSSPLPCRVPARISLPNCRNVQDYDWCRAGDKCGGDGFSCVTAHGTPRYTNPTENTPVTPAKSVSGADFGVLRRFLNVPNHPNYMANTQSFEAKVRSQSAPKQRPEPFAGMMRGRRQPLSEVMLESRASLSGVGMQRSCARVQEAFSFKSAAAVGGVEGSEELGPQAEREFYLQRKW